MNIEQKNDILSKAKTFFKDMIVTSHIKNTKKLTTLKEFNINPFLLDYLANYLTGNNNPESLAKALIYPRVLSTSITTTFGTQLQYFCSSVLSGFASTTSGIDIEFIDQIDGRKKYCQIKAGPNTINKDDVATIIGHFRGIKDLARTNRLDVRFDDLIVGVFYGTPSQLSMHYRNIAKEHTVLVGEEFWYHLTGDTNFYNDLISAVGEVAIEEDGREVLNETIEALAEDIRKKGL